ncbi:MAG: c-type cytochrome domain-containing protein, partial [Planctomyces sp.]
MIPRFFGVFALFSVSLVVGSASAAQQESADQQAQFFHEKVLPLLEARCFECHGDGDVEGGLLATSRETLLEGGETGPAIVPGDPDRSLLIQAVRYETLQMPPRDKLPDEEVALLVKWVADGAVWPAASSAPAPAAMSKAQFPLQERIQAHWSWKPIQRPSIPQVQRVD